MDLLSFQIAVLIGYTVIHVHYSVQVRSCCKPRVVYMCAGPVVSIYVIGKNHTMKPGYILIDEI